MTAGGQEIRIDLTLVGLIEQGVCVGTAAVATEARDRRRTDAEIVRSTFYDGLTDLPNATLFLRRLGRALRRRNTATVAVLFLNLDHFSSVNDRLGRPAGDAVLRSIAALLRAALHDSDTIARYGTDEFAVVTEVQDEHEAVAVATRLLDAIRVPFGTTADRVSVTASIGITLASPGGSPEEAIAHAAAAMRRAKAAGGRRYELFDEALQQRTLRRLEAEAEMAEAIEQQQFVVHYQPIIDLSSGSVAGADALLRWEHPARGLIRAGEFLPFAEETGQILELGSAVLQRALSDLAHWNAERPEHPLFISVKLSVRQILDEGIVESVAGAIRQTGVAPSSVHLSLSGSASLADHDQIAARVSSLSTLGVKLSMDDFGTGYCSLTYLKRLPLSAVKIDRSFIAGVGQNPEDTAVVRAVLKMAEALGLDAVAEGIETEEQRAALVALGCRYGKGFLWSDAVPPSHVLALAGKSRRKVRSPGAKVPGRAVIDPSADEVLSIVTHELRTPVTVISGYAEMLQEQFALDEPTMKELRAISRACANISTILESLRDLQALDSGTLTLNPSDADLTAVVRDLVNELSVSLAGRKVDVSAPASLIARIDAQRIRQVLTNLLTNAHRYSPPRAPIHVHIEPDGTSARVRVIDYGPGVPVEHANKIFRKFARGDARQHGHGLGLYISQGIARSHGGDLRYRRAATGGAEFVLTLPLAASTESPSTLAPSAAPDREEPSGLNAAAEKLRLRPMGPSGAGVSAPLRALRALLHATTPEEVVGIAIDLVHDLGGVVVPATLDDGTAMPVDLSFGVGEPLLPYADPVSVPRMLLEELLPRFVEDARHAVAQLRLREQLA
ncbi:MAG: EAL domain-containing protein, partial [Acidimicrobiia bacterium]